MPDYGRAQYNHGQVLLMLNWPEQAEVALKKALKLEPQNRDFFFALATSFLNSKQTVKAKNLAIETLKAYPGHAGAKELMKYLEE